MVMQKCKLWVLLLLLVYPYKYIWLLDEITRLIYLISNYSCFCIFTFALFFIQQITNTIQMVISACDFSVGFLCDFCMISVWFLCDSDSCVPRLTPARGPFSAPRTPSTGWSSSSPPRPPTTPAGCCPDAPVSVRPPSTGLGWRSLVTSRSPG